MALTSAQRDSKLIELKARNEGTLNMLERNLLKMLEKRQFSTPASRERVEIDKLVGVEVEKAGL